MVGGAKACTKSVGLSPKVSSHYLKMKTTSFRTSMSFCPVSQKSRLKNSRRCWFLSVSKYRVQIIKVGKHLCRSIRVSEKTSSLKLANPVATYIVHHQAYHLKKELLMHSVEISGFFCHSEFTRNQFWRN